MIQRSRPLQPLAWPGLGNGPQLWHLRQTLDAFHAWNSTPILSLGTSLALSGHCNWSSMCPHGPSPSISWRVRHTSHHHVLSGCETHSLNSRFLRLFCPLWLQGPLTQGALPVMHLLRHVPCLFFMRPNYLCTELKRTHTGTSPGQEFSRTYRPRADHPPRDLV